MDILNLFSISKLNLRISIESACPDDIKLKLSISLKYFFSIFLILFNLETIMLVILFSFMGDITII